MLPLPKDRRCTASVLRLGPFYDHVTRTTTALLGARRVDVEQPRGVRTRGDHALPTNPSLTYLRTRIFRLMYHVMFELGDLECPLSAFLPELPQSSQILIPTRSHLLEGK